MKDVLADHRPLVTTSSLTHFWLNYPYSIEHKGRRAWLQSILERSSPSEKVMYGIGVCIQDVPKPGIR